MPLIPEPLHPRLPPNSPPTLSCHPPPSPPGGENGFNQAIELSAETLSNVKFIQEKKLITRWEEEGAVVVARMVHMCVVDWVQCV